MWLPALKTAIFLIIMKTGIHQNMAFSELATTSDVHHLVGLHPYQLIHLSLPQRNILSKMNKFT